jgi:putative flippase GtrA
MKWSKEFLRYVAVGVTVNGCGYLLYVLITSLGVSPVLTISIFYPISISLAFYFNKKWSFSHQGRIPVSAIKYLIAYFICYILNVAVLKFFSGYLGYSHLMVQAIAIIVMAFLMFLAQKYWVFKNSMHLEHVL